jgi:hypothetical protein
MFLFEIAMLALWMGLTLKLVHDSPNRRAPMGRSGNMPG